MEKRIIDTRSVLGLYYIQLNYHIEAKEAVDPIVELALERNYRRRISQIYTIIGAYNWAVTEDFPKAFKYLEDALEIAEELNDVLSLVMARVWLLIAQGFACEFEKGIHYMEKALEINVATNTLWGVSRDKSCMALALNWWGKTHLAYQTSDEALRIAEESGDINSKAWAYTAIGLSYYEKGFLDEAEGHLVKGVDFCERIHSLVFGGLASIYLGDICFDRGRYDTSQEHYEKAIYLFQLGRLLPSWINLNRISIARARVMSNEKDINLNEIFKCYKDNKFKTLEGWMLRYIGEILLNIDDQQMDEAEDWVKRAIEADKRNGTMWELGMAHRLYAELFRRKGNLSGAKENLNTAIEILKECGADGWVKRYEEELAKM